MTDQGKDSFVIVISSDEMGQGSHELGKILMKSFIGALTEHERRPDYILFVNAGVRLTTEGSNALEDLLDLESTGTRLLSCGTCLNYFELGQPLAGEISNMASILAVMAGAEKLINI
ncbi:MAG TPA: sulfurtransferase-like selenium metabolism protein YedF [Clostridiaceae bacterium]|nr:sulfurtransferase-like selenium metabolism protein YedF [Clostridiaceae bacterium]